MTRILLAWQSHPQPQGTSLFPHDLSEVDAVVRLFKEASRFRAQITAEGWRFLWTRYGRRGLLEINAQAGWIAGDSDREVIEQLTSRSLIAGYNPVSETFRGYFERIETQEPYL